ncbi:hypothetical protein [Streptomyces sp. CBMA156]|uniref:hypothetical protein n=1 Tax=Streptomyces sp. CBMA156 TaxID=1930280 RepID=UPI001661A364|nr:hypothetical protein [Streptomyces sp. CBMA156]
MTVAAVVLAGGLTACGGAGGGTAGGPSAAAAPGGTAAGSGTATGGKAAGLDPKAALAAAAEVMRKAGGGRYALSAPDGLEAKPGAGFASWGGRPAAIEYLGDAPGAKLRVRVVGNEAYMGPTEQAAAAVGQQTFWSKMPFLMWRRPFYPQLSLAMDPVTRLTVAQAGRLSRVGTETVDGAEVTRYRAVEDVAAVLGGIPDLTEEHRPHVEVALRKGGGTYTVDFWLNARQELVRFREFGEQDGEAKAVTVTYSALGTAPAMEAPAEQDLRKSFDLDPFLDPSPATAGPGPEAA